MADTWDKTNDAYKGATRGSFLSMIDPTLSAIGSLITEQHPDAKHSAIMIARGAKNRKEIEHQYKLTANSDFKRIRDKVHKEIYKLHSNGETSVDTPHLSAEKEANAVSDYILGDMHKSGNYSSSINAKRIDQAIQAVVGGTPIPVQGCILRPVRCMPADEFQDTLKVVTKYILEKSGKVGQESYPEYYGYTNLDGGRYLLTQNRIPVRDDEGNPVVIDIRSLPKDVITKMAAEQRELDDANKKLAGILSESYMS